MLMTWIGLATPGLETRQVAELCAVGVLQQGLQHGQDRLRHPSLHVCTSIAGASCAGSRRIMCNAGRHRKTVGGTALGCDTTPLGTGLEAQRPVLDGSCIQQDVASAHEEPGPVPKKRKGAVARPLRII